MLISMLLNDLDDVMKGSIYQSWLPPLVLIFENIVQRMVPNDRTSGAHVISCTKGIKLDPFRSMSDIISENIDKNH